MSEPAAPVRDSALPAEVVVGWGLGSLGLAVILNTLNVLLVAYLTLIVGLEPALAGTLVLVAKLYDVLTDLPMGWASDRTRTRWGPRRPYLMLAALISPLALVMLFRVPVGDATTYVLVALLLYASGYTLFNVPYLSMPAELTPNVNVRTRMVAFRSAFIAAGTFFGIAVAPFLIGSLGSGADAYATLGLVMAVVVGIAFLSCFWLTGKAPAPALPARLPPLSEQLAVVARDANFRNLMWIKVTHLLALALYQGTLLFYFRFALDYDARVLGLFGAVSIACWVVSMPFWTRLARAYGKRVGYFVATSAYALLTLSWLFGGSSEPLWAIVLRGVGFGLASGGMLLMGNAMLQDIMDHDFRATGERKNGIFAGVYSLVEKITSGVGAQILGLVLSYTGFDRAAEAQPASAVTGIYVVVALLPALLMLVSLIVIYRYRLDERELMGAAG